MKLWDLRKLSATTGGATTSAAACLHIWGGFEHGIAGCAAYMQTAISWRRSKVAVTSLQVRPNIAYHSHCMRSVHHVFFYDL